MSYTHCSFCKKETRCTYGLVSTAPGTLAENHLYCSKRCLDAHSHELGLDTATERRLTALEQRVDALATRIDTLTGVHPDG